VRKREHEKAAGTGRGEITEAERNRADCNRPQNSGTIEEPAHHDTADGESHHRHRE